MLLIAPLLAQELPTENPREVWVKGRKLSHSWRDGRIFVPTVEIGPLLNIESEYRSVDLVKALEKKGGYLFSVENGVFQAVRDRSQYSSNYSAAKARAHNRREDRRMARVARRKAEEASLPQLKHQVQKFVAETGFVRAYIRVTNVGGSASAPHKLIADFTDGYGKAFARDTTVVSSLQPGEHQDFELFSMIRDEETIANGVIRTVNNEKVKVTLVKLR